MNIITSSSVPYITPSLLFFSHSLPGPRITGERQADRERLQGRAVGEI